MVTAIEGGIAVVFDGNEHRLLKDGVIIFEDDKIIHVGKSYSGPVERRIDASGKLVIPGLINTHCHGDHAPLTKSIRGDGSSRQFYNSDLYDRFVIISANKEETRAIAEFSMMELLGSGCTTVVDLGFPDMLGADAVDIVAKIGIRGYICKGYKSGGWYTDDGKRIRYRNYDGEKWNEEPGLHELRDALGFISKYDGSHDGRIRSLLYPAHADSCSPALLKETRREADERNLGIQIHVSQSIIEFQEIMKRYGKTPVEFLSEVGLLGRDTIAGHCVMKSGHSKVGYTDPWENDLRILSESGTSVAHCPVVFSRYGVALESYWKYVRAGINVTIGTDTFPQDMIREMSLASTISKLVEKEASVATCRDVFNSATLGGAKALRRNDLGRIAQGAKADIVLVNLRTFNMAPVRDPIRNFVMCATRSDVDTVVVDGRIAMEGGKIPGVELSVMAERVQKIAERVWDQLSDSKGRKVDDLVPQSFKPLE